VFVWKKIIYNGHAVPWNTCSFSPLRHVRVAQLSTERVPGESTGFETECSLHYFSV
jgi:hypothetical protein